MLKKTFLLNKLWIVTGSVQSGKTSQLKEFIAGKQVAGFLTPDKGGRRIFLDIGTGEEYTFQTEDWGQDGVVRVGRFCFLSTTFDIGSEMIEKSRTGDVEYFIIDEFGKLELEGRGFGRSIDALLRWLPTSDNRTIYIMVVRDYLLNDFLAKYNLTNSPDN